MLYQLYYSACIIIHPFALATFTAIAICNYYKYPFISPKFTIDKIAERLQEMSKNIPMLLGQSILFNYIVYPNLQSNESHDIPTMMIMMSLYVILIELNYYIYHRWIHANFYPYIHKKHHQNVDVYPFDTFFLTYTDDLASILSLGIPIIILPITFIEQFIIVYIYITCSYLSHSNLFWKHHVLHHKYLNCNYCILFPIFDILCKTYRAK